MKLLLLFALITAACQLCDAATPIRAQWLEEPSKPTHTSANPLLQWWSALTTGHPSPAVTSDAKEPPECIWQDFPTHDALKAWEFQAQPRRHMVSHMRFPQTPNTRALSHTCILTLAVPPCTTPCRARGPKPTFPPTHTLLPPMHFTDP